MLVKEKDEAADDDDNDDDDWRRKKKKKNAFRLPLPPEQKYKKKLVIHSSGFGIVVGVWWCTR